MTASTPVLSHPLTDQGPFAGFRRLRAAIAEAFQRAVKRAQVARMIEVLSKLDTRALAEIGIERKEIPAYAVWLIHGGGDGFRTAGPRPR